MSTSNLIGPVYEPGTVIFRQGEPGDTLYLIQSGAVEYSYKQGDTETVLTILEKGDFFGEMALFGQERRPATARAIRRTRLLPLTRASLLETDAAGPGRGPAPSRGPLSSDSARRIARYSRRSRMTRSCARPWPRREETCPRQTV